MIETNAGHAEVASRLPVRGESERLTPVIRERSNAEANIARSRAKSIFVSSNAHRLPFKRPDRQ